MVIGVNDRLEIWSESKFNEYFNQNDDNISDIAEDATDRFNIRNSMAAINGNNYAL